MDIKVEIQPKEIIANVLTPVEPIYGGTKNYENLENLPSINGIEIIGNLTLEKLGIQPQGDYAKRSELPQNVSDLNNDAGYLVQRDLTDYAKLENLPTKVSELENDSDYATISDLPTKTSELENDSDFSYVSDIPTKVSELENDSSYLVRSDIASIDSHVADFDNPHKVLKSQVGLGNVDNTSDADKPLSIAQKKYIDDSYANSNAYTDQKIADLIGGAPETLDTLKEVAEAIAESKDVETALNNAIGTKANQTELDTHTRNDTIHITSSERTNWNDANSKKHTHSNKSVIDKITQTLLDNWNAAYNHISDTVKHITSEERTTWNNKYAKPTNGIPKSDLASAVQTSLGKADTALQSVTKESIGLGNVDNTSDEDKPISKAQQAEFDKLNSNLVDLEVGSTHGGNNIFKLRTPNFVGTEASGSYGGTTYTINDDILQSVAYAAVAWNVTVEIGETYTISLTNPNNKQIQVDGNAKPLGSNFTFTATSNTVKIAVCYGGSITSEDLQTKIMINKGKTAKSYNKWIPSVSQLNESLDDYGLLNKVTEMRQGKWNISSGVSEGGDYYVSSKESISCNGNSNIKLKCDNAEAFDIVFFNGSSFISGESKNGSELSFTTPSNATSFKFNIYNGNKLTLQNVGKIEVYVDSQIEQLKNDLTTLQEDIPKKYLLSDESIIKIGGIEEIEGNDCLKLVYKKGTVIYTAYIKLNYITGVE